MNIWPNWVDLIVIILIARMAYNGFGHGVLTELLNVLSAITIVCLTLNYRELVRHLPLSLPLSAPLLDLLSFWLLFLVLTVVVHMILARVSQLVKWERIHWFLQGIGLLLGGLRGFWWAAFIVMVMTAGNLPPLQDSLDKSVLGPKMLTTGRALIEQTADRFPGASLRTTTPIPPFDVAPKKH